MKKLSAIALAAAFSLSVIAMPPAKRPVYADPNADIEKRVEDALSRMTTRDKINIIHAQSKFSSPGVPSLGIPELWTSDGPHGVRPEVLWDEWDQANWTSDSCVAFPALTALAATWNPDMAAKYGHAVGEEALYRGKDILLGPGVNIYRTPLNGRNFEYMGEDPYLSSRMVVPYVQGLQDNGVAACVKHFALNNNEINRHTSNVLVDDRTLYEIYLPAFKAAVQEGGAWSIMASYNLVDGRYMCHHIRLLKDILKDEWGFDGVVVSDWGGVHDTDEVVHGGLDLEFGSWTNGLSNGRSNAYDNYFMAQPYVDMIEKGEIGTEELDDRARRVLRLIFRTAMNNEKGFGALNSPQHYQTARRIADEGIVLLKNDNKVLPIKGDKKKILVAGENAIKVMTVGGGSSSLKVQHETSPLEGITAAANELGYDVEYARAYVGDLGGVQDGVSVGQDISDNRSADEILAEAVAKAKDADYVIFVGGLNKAPHQDCEDSDRAGLELPYNQDAVIEALAAANPNTVVVNISGNAVAMPWVKKVPSIVQAWYLGSEAGNGIADVLFGKVNPSGKLPFTFPVKLSDNAAHALGAYPGVQREDSPLVDIEYKEGVLVGYRWHDTKKIKPLFAFGHGLSYTDFTFGKATIDAKEISGDDATVTVTVPVTNTGDVAGAEVVQCYVSDPKASVLRPAKELKAFEKVYLRPGETKEVSFTIDRQALSFFDADKHQWVAEPGDFILHIGAASDDIRTTAKFKLK